MLIEAKTYRRKGHAEHDDQRYCAPGEIEWWEKNNDPVDRYERYLLDCKLATKEKLEEIAADVFVRLTRIAPGLSLHRCPKASRLAYGVFDNNIVPPAFRPKVLEG